MGLTFDANNDYCTRAEVQVNDFTICAWVKIGSGTTEIYPLMCWTTTVGFARYGYGLLVRPDSGGGADGGKIQMLTADGSSNYFRKGTVNVRSNTWRHIACTFVRNGNGLLYVDGASETVSATTGSPIAAVGYTGDNLNIARLLYQGNYSVFGGTFADVRLYNRVLSLTELNMIYNERGRDGITASMVGRWLMNERPEATAASGSASDVRDVSPAGNHMTSYGGPIYAAGPFRLY